jgi:3-oxoacyl-[acyl-carrier protein] reductase
MTHTNPLATTSQAQPLALVIGGSGAIGRAITEELIGLGYAVLASHRSPVPPMSDTKVRWVYFDATTGTCDQVSAALGDERQPLQVVVFATGIASSKAAIFDTPTAEWHSLISVNAFALVQVWQAIAGRARSASARVVVISSETVRTAGAGNGPYTASKAALEAIALTLAKEEAKHGVRVNIVSPSLVDSPQARTILASKGVIEVAHHFQSQPWGRVLEPAEVAAVVAALAHEPYWQYATGQVIRLAANFGGAVAT